MRIQARGSILLGWAGWISVCILFPMTASGQSTTTIFSGTRIGFGGGQTREIRKSVTFPVFAPTDQISLDWDVLGDADPWDRAGSIHVLLPGGKQIQLGKFVTGFNGTTSHSQDISDLAPLLSGQTLRLEAFIDTWVADAWHFNASVTSQPGTTPNPTWMAPIISRDTGFGRGGDAGTTTKEYTFDVPEMEDVILTYFASGHHADQTSNSDEFNQRMHHISVDGVEVWSGIPWRTDGPNFRSVNPTSGRWDGNHDGDTTDPYPIDQWSSDFPRSGWVPGDEVAPYKFDMTPYLGDAGTHTVSLTIDNMDVNSFWRVSAYLSGTLPTGDFDGDGDVDGADFLEWQRNSSTLGAEDLANWKATYGDGISSAVAAATSVPEPGTAVLLVSLGLVVGAWQKRWRDYCE